MLSQCRNVLRQKTINTMVTRGLATATFKAAPATLPTCKLNSGYEKPMPMIGMGTFTGTRLTQKAEPGTMQKTVLEFLKRGGRMVDCAQNYLNEAEIGDALAEAFSSGEVSRDDVWISSKLNNPYHRKEHVRPAMEKTLLDLGLDYVDLYLMHWPTAFVHVPYEEGDLERRGLSMDYEPDQCTKVTGVQWKDYKGSWPPPHLDMNVTIHETWQAMVELKEAGLAKNIGVCNTQVQLLHELLCGTDTKPQIVQHEAHPYCQQWDLLQYCNMNDIQFQAYSPLGYGEFVGDNEVKVLENPVLQKIAEKHGRGTGPGGVAAVVLAWHVVHRKVATMPMTLKGNEMEGNLSTGTLTLDKEDLAQIRTLDRNHHYLRPQDWYGLPYWG